jgi:hypothetical protein
MDAGVAKDGRMESGHERRALSAGGYVAAAEICNNRYAR